MRRALVKGGAVYWRSAARRPWYARISNGRGSPKLSPTVDRYIARFEELGFRVEALAIRQPGCREPIDRVNMVCRPICP